MDSFPLSLCLFRECYRPYREISTTCPLHLKGSGNFEGLAPFMRFCRSLSSVTSALLYTDVAWTRERMPLLSFLFNDSFHHTLTSHSHITHFKPFLRRPQHTYTHTGTMLAKTLLACTALLTSSVLNTVSAKMTYETKGPEMIYRRDTDWKYNPTNYLFFDPNDDPIQPKKECTVEVAETRKPAA